MSALDMVVTALFYGRAGTGKTTIAGSFPKPLLLLDISEKGTDSVADEKGIDVIHVQDWDEMEEIYWELESGESKYKTVVVDALHAAQALAIQKAKGDRNKDSNEQTSKHDFMKASGILQRWVTHYRDLEEKGIHVIFICHDRLSSGEDNGEEEGVLAPEVGPRLMPSIASLVTGAVKVVGHTFIKETLERSKTLGKKPTRRVDYCLRIGPHGYYTTKIRSPKTAEVPDYLKNPTFEKIVEVMKGMKGKTPATVSSTNGPKKKVLRKKS